MKDDMEAAQTLVAINPWWKDGRISKELAKPYRRKVFAEVKRLMGYRQATMITGMRRVGKSTLMFQMIEELLGKVPAERVVYFSFDLGSDSLLKILDEYSRVNGSDWKKGKLFVFLDEIQKLGGWQNEVKLLYDNFPMLKLVVSGSSSVSLEKEAISALAGRYFPVNVEPLSFAEFLEMGGNGKYAAKPLVWQSEIRKEFSEYARKPFPEITGWKDELLIRKYIRESVLDKVLRSDLPARFKGINEELLLKLVEMFYSQPGMLLSYDSLASEMKVSRKTLAKHIFYLEFAYLIRRVRNFRSRQFMASRKMQKIYPYHWAFVYAVGGGDISESLVASTIDAKFYWRKGPMEIDFIAEDGGLLPVEVKSGNARRDDLGSILYFCGKNRLGKAVVVHGGESKSEKHGKVDVSFMPFWEFALKLVSKNKNI